VNEATSAVARHTGQADHHVDDTGEDSDDEYDHSCGMILGEVTDRIRRADEGVGAVGYSATAPDSSRGPPPGRPAAAWPGGS
jgi:hypothetical protein